MAIRVLPVDDHPSTCTGLRAMLAAVPDVEVVGEAHDGLDAQRLVAELQPDVVLLDLVIPCLQPVEFARWVRERYPGTEVLPLTAHDLDCYLAWMMEAGAAGYLNKNEASRRWWGRSGGQRVERRATRQSSRNGRGADGRRWVNGERG